MKLNNLSRLTALLMALVLFSTTCVVADTSTDLSSLTGSYMDCVAWASDMVDQGYCATCLDALARSYIKSWPVAGYSCLYDHLEGMTVMTRYTFLTDIYAQYKAATDSTTQDYYYGLYMGYWRGANGHTDADATQYPQLICCSGCTVYNQNALVAPGSSHLAGTCPWYNNYASLAEQFAALTTNDERIAFVAPLTDEQLYGMLDVLGWIEGKVLSTDDVKVKGALPEGTELTATALGTDKVNNDVLGAFLSTIQGENIVVEEFETHSSPMLGYNVELSFYGREIQPKSALYITYFNAWDTAYLPDFQEHYAIHVLDSEAGIEKEAAAGKTLYYDDSSVLAKVYASSKAVKAAADSGYTTGGIVYTVDSYGHGGVTLNTDGSVTWTVYSLSDSYETNASYYASGNIDEFYWRIEGEGVNPNTGYQVGGMNSSTTQYITTGTGDGNHATNPYYDADNPDAHPLRLCDVIESVKYVNGNGGTGSVEHRLYDPDNTATTTGLKCETVLGAKTTTATASLYITTKLGYIVTSYRIGCEIHNSDNPDAQPGDLCQSVEHGSLKVTPSLEGDAAYRMVDYEIKIDASTFGHRSSDNVEKGRGIVDYVLILEVAQVNVNLNVVKTANRESITAGKNESIIYNVTATTENDLSDVQFADEFIKYATINSVMLDGTALTKVNSLTTLASGVTPTQYTVDTTNGVITLNGTWKKADGAVVITYTYSTTATSTGTLTNTVYAQGTVAGATISDYGVAQVNVLIVENTTGTMRVYKTFTGISDVDADTFAAMRKNFTLSATGDSSITFTYAGSTTSNDGVVMYYWDATGITPGTYTLKESNYELTGYSVLPSWTYKTDGEDDTTISGKTDTITDIVIEKAKAYIVNYTNEYTQQPQNSTLTITKTVAGENAPTDDTFTIQVKLPTDGTYPYTVDGTASETGLVVTNGVGTLSIKAAEVIVISDIPIDSDFTVTEIEVPTYFDASAEVTGTIDEDGETVEVINTYQTGSLTITKSVVGDTAPKTTDEFTFTLDLSNKQQTYSYTKGTTTGEVEYDGTLKLKDGETVTITGIPLGTDYTVTEAEDEDYTPNPADRTKKGTISTTTEAAFTNTYLRGDLTITKKVEGENAPTGDSFTFTVTLTPAANTSLGASYSVDGTTVGTPTWTTNNGVLTGVFTLQADVENNATATIKDIPNGTMYTVTEAAAVGYTTNIKTTQDNTNEGAIDAGKVDAVLVTNTYAVGSLNVTKYVEGTVTDVYPKTFGFVLEIKDEAGQVITPDIMIDGAAASASNGVYSFDLIDDQTAIITGIPQNVTYTVTENAQAEGKAVVDYFEVSATGETVSNNVVSGKIVAGTADTATFTNTAKTGSLTITKKIKGDGANDSDTFIFTVTGPKNYSTSVVLTGSQSGKSVILTNLPFGAYTVQENEAWSWRYTLDNGNNKSADVMPGVKTSVEFINNRTKNQWLDGETEADNKFN